MEAGLARSMAGSREVLAGCRACSGQSDNTAQSAALTIQLRSFGSGHSASHSAAILGSDIEFRLSESLRCRSEFMESEYSAAVERPFRESGLERTSRTRPGCLFIDGDLLKVNSAAGVDDPGIAVGSLDGACWVDPPPADGP